MTATSVSYRAVDKDVHVKVIKKPETVRRDILERELMEYKAAAVG